MPLTRRTLVSILVILYGRWGACNECIDGDYAPDPYDCNGYLQCQFGRWVQRYCSRDLHFNRHVFACDFPWNANCELQGSTTTTTPEDPTVTPTDPPTGPPTESPTGPPTGPPTESPTGPPTDPPTGPPTDPPPTTTTTTTAFPSTTTTTTAFPSTTTTTTTFPTTTTIPTTSTSPPTITTTTTNSPTITTGPPGDPTTTTLLPTHPPILECTPHDGQYVLHLPHPDCTMFYKCVHGIPHEMLCPFAQQWAIALDRCDSPSEANCVDGAARRQENARPPNYW